MRFVILFLVGCSGTVSNNGANCDDAEPNGYCETSAACDPADHCVLERVLDSHLQTPTVSAVPVERCWPRSGAGDWCDDQDWCSAGLTCTFQSASASRGICR